MRIDRWHKRFVWYKFKWMWARCFDCRGWPLWSYRELSLMTEDEALAENKEDDEILNKFCGNDRYIQPWDDKSIPKEVAACHFASGYWKKP